MPEEPSGLALEGNALITKLYFNNVVMLFRIEEKHRVSSYIAGPNLGMHHIRGRFRESHAGSRQVEHPAVNVDQAWLPTELLIVVASYVLRREDLARLCRTSRVLYRICTPLLYQTIDINTRDRGSHARRTLPCVGLQLYLYWALQNVRFSQLVTEFHVTLVDRRICDHYIYYPRPSCSCKGYARALGKAILSLKNLQVLAIRCDMCRGTHSHEYLLHLDMPKLTHLEFRCFGSSPSERRRPASDSLFLAPYMRNITALALECDADRLYQTTEEYHPALHVAGLSPNLHTLTHTGAQYCTDILATRPVERLCIKRTLGKHVSLLHETICLSPGELSHLLMFDILEWLARAMMRDLEPYRYLRCIGTIEFPHPEENAALNAMRAFTSLTYLEVIEINRMPCREDDFLGDYRSIQPLLMRLGQQHPSLRRVFLEHRHGSRYKSFDGFTPDLWEKCATWEKRFVPHLDYWDILNGKLDGLYIAQRAPRSEFHG